MGIITVLFKNGGFLKKKKKGFLKKKKMSYFWKTVRVLEFLKILFERIWTL